MAEIDHIKMLCHGVEHWNEARAMDKFQPDLSQIEIRDAKLSGIDFRSVEFDGTRFLNVEAKDAKFQNARLNGILASRTTFQGSDLRNVELKGADFKYSSVSSVDLTGATSFDLKIRHCDLSGAQFDDAHLALAHFYNSDLNGTFFGNANVDDAMFKRVNIEDGREAELKQAGARTSMVNKSSKDEWIDWHQYCLKDHGDDFGSILYRNQLYWINEGRWDFFVSHTSVDKQTVAAPLVKALEDLGQRVWLDQQEVKVGDDLTTVLKRGTQASLFGVIIASKDFFGRQWTEFELKALERKRLFLVRHELTAEELTKMRPELAGRVTIGSEAGPEQIAKALVEAIRTPRPQDD